MTAAPTTGTSEPNVTAGIRRVIKRDDQLQLAFEAEAALEIARTLSDKQLRAVDGSELFQLAFDLHLTAARERDQTRYTRAQSLSYAGKILEFCDQTDYPLQRHGHTPDSLFTEALADATSADRRRQLRREPTRAVLIGQLAARSLRLAGNADAARALVAKPEGYFFATGAERMRARYEQELIVGLIQDGQANQVRHALTESEDFWQQGRAVRFADRHRYRYAIAIADWEVGRLAEAKHELYRSLAELDEGAKGAIDDWPELCRLSLTLALAEMHLELASRPADGRADSPTADRAKSIQWLDQARGLTQQMRARWRVIIRSRSPLSTVIQRVWGDMARVTAELGGEDANRLGARIVLAAKQSGFASLMRAERSLLITDGREGAGGNDRPRTKVVGIVGIIDEISEREAQRIDYQLGARVRTQEDVAEELRHLRKQLTPVLADFVLPRPVDLDQISRNLGDHVALDFVGLQDTLSERLDRPSWYRTLFIPGSGVEFGRMLPGAAFDAFFHDADAWVTRLDEGGAIPSEVWAGLGKELLPDALWQRLNQPDPAPPIRLVISGHGRLSHFPWAALQVDGARLLHKAIIAQALDLTGLTGDPVAEITGPALVRLVAKPIASFGALDVGAECAAWGVSGPGSGSSPPMYRVEQIGEVPTELEENFTAALDAKNYRFLHVAAHGTGDGLAQRVYLPKPLSAGAALGLRWPPAVLMACCRLGRVNNRPDTEPFGFVICLLSAKARGVVAGVGEIDDRGTGTIASSMVMQAHAGSVPIDEALRTAQLDLLKHQRPLNEWALLTTYVC